MVTKLAEVLGRHPGELPSRVEVFMPEVGRHISFELGAEFGVAATEAFFEDLERQMGRQGLATLM